MIITKECHTPDSLRNAAAKFFCLFAFFYPLVTGSRRDEANGNTSIVLLMTTVAAAAILYLHFRFEPFRWTIWNRVPAVLAGLTTLYAIALLGATYGVGRPEIFLVPFVVVGAVSLLLRPGLLTTFVSNQVKISFFVFLSVVVIVCTLSHFQHVTFVGSYFRRTGALQTLGCAMLFLSVVVFARTEGLRKRILRAALGGGCVVAVIALWQFFDPGGWAMRLFGDLNFDPRPMSTMGQPNWLGTYLCLLFPLAAAWFLAANSRCFLCLTSLNCLLLFAALLVCQTRGAWVAIGFFLLWLAFHHRACWRRLIPLYILFALVVFALLPCKEWTIYRRMLTMEREVERIGAGSGAAGSGRLGYWRYGLSHLPSYCVLGSGLDTFAEIGEKDPVPPRMDKAHSIYLEYAITLGLPGLAAYLYFLWGCVKPRPDVTENLVRWGIRAAILTYLVQGIFIHDTIQTWPILWLLLGLAAAKDHSPENETARAA